MNQLLPKRKTLSLFWIVLAFVPFISSCGGSSDNSPDAQVKPPAIEETASAAASPTPEEFNEISQDKIEEMAEKSLNTAVVDTDFDFQSQRSITLDLNFTHTQLETKVGIYSALDTQSDTPTNLLEQGLINQSNRYRSTLSITTEVASIFIVINDDENNFVEVAIDRNTNISYHFEEY